MRKEALEMIQTIGHRGAAALEPENTLRSFRRAIEIGVDYVEFDVHRCKSGELVVIHDETVDRTTNGKGAVAELTLQELKKLDAGKGERIPTLQETIDCCNGKAKMQIELKAFGLEEDTVAAIEKNSIAAEVVVISFYHEGIKKIKEVAETRKIRIKTGALIVGNPVNASEIAKAAKADYISANQNFTDERMVKNLKNAGIGIVVWNCDTEKDIKRLAALGVDVIGSNKPDLLIKVLGR